MRLVLKLQPKQGVQKIGESGYNWDCEVLILVAQCVIDIVLECLKYLRALPIIISLLK
jgi:hypothetical protein